MDFRVITLCFLMMSFCWPLVSYAEDVSVGDFFAVPEEQKRILLEIEDVKLEFSMPQSESAELLSAEVDSANYQVVVGLKMKGIAHTAFNEKKFKKEYLDYLLYDMCKNETITEIIKKEYAVLLQFYDVADVIFYRHRLTEESCKKAIHNAPEELTEAP